MKTFNITQIIRVKVRVSSLRAKQAHREAEMGHFQYITLVLEGGWCAAPHSSYFNPRKRNFKNSSHQN
jgi:hypothetical protein